MEATRCTFATLIAVLLTLSGCKLWNEKQSAPPSELPTPRVSDDTVMVELARISLTDEEIELFESSWAEIDEQILPIEQRRVLAENGIRVGLINFHVPVAIRDIMAGGVSSQADGSSSDGLVSIDQQQRIAINHRRFPKGKRSEYVLGATVPEISILEAKEGKIQGKTYRQAQCKLAMRATPQNDGRVTMEVLPEIHHGNQKQHIAADQGMFRIETRQERKVFDQAKFAATVQSGQTLVITSTQKPRGLGQALFQRDQSGIAQRQVVLLRLSGSQFDDLFQTSKGEAEMDSLSSDSTGNHLPTSFD